MKIENIPDNNGSDGYAVIVIFARIVVIATATNKTEINLVRLIFANKILR